MKVINIKWDADEKTKKSLPKEIPLHSDFSAEDIDKISDYISDVTGFCHFGFDIDESNEITVLLVEPGKYPREIKIENTLKAMQDIVGGYIERSMMFDDDVAVICNEEGKIKGLLLNRAIYGQDEKVIDVIAGTFFLCYAPADSDSFLSMPKALMEKYKEIFKLPEKFAIDQTGKIIATKFDPESNK